MGRKCAAPCHHDSSSTVGAARELGTQTITTRNACLHSEMPTKVKIHLCIDYCQHSKTLSETQRTILMLHDIEFELFYTF